MFEIVVDNFAGGGGTSTGIEEARGCSVEVAINHDASAITMHEVNHPETKHYQEDVWAVDPKEVAAGRPVALNWLSPSCTHHSNAAGGKPKNKQLRGQAWLAVKWAATVRPRVQILENVREFQSWGPLLKNGQPDPKRKGLTYNSFVNAIRRQGYAVETNLIKACDFGAPTLRERFFMAMRRDGKPIVWPEPSHGDPDSMEVKSGLLKPWRTAGEIIDWSIPCKSIFGRKKPLAPNTMRRIALGTWKWVINAEKPFIAPVPYDQEGDHSELVSSFLIQYHSEARGDVRGQSLDRPLLTLDTSNRYALVTAHLVKMKGTNIGQSADAPLQTITAGGLHFGLVQCFLIQYNGASIGQPLNRPLGTVPTHDRFGLVMVYGTLYQIVDIRMRMLVPRELFRAQGFPDSYIIDRDKYGNPYPITAQVARCGNSVSPVVARALFRSNLPELCIGAGTALAFERYKQQEGQMQMSM